MQFLYFLESIRTPFWNAVLGALTYLGDETVFMVIAIIVYWCISKNWGYYILTVGFFSVLINQFSKILCRIPRPWVRDPSFTIVESARAAAAGYSFPSGHTASIAAGLGCCARLTKKKWLCALFLVLIAAVSFSRMYLGVHYPADVLFSLAVSAVLVFAAYPAFARGSDRDLLIRLLVTALTVLSLCFAVWVHTKSWPADVDAENLSSAMKNSWVLTGCGAGMLLSLFVEQKYVKFDVRAPWWAQILKVALGLALLLAIRIGLKLVLPGAVWWSGLRYFCVVFFGASIWPMSFPWFARGCKREVK